MQGSTTYKEFARTSRRTGPVGASRRSRERAHDRGHHQILKGLKTYYEEFHKLRYTNDAIKRGGAVGKYIRPQAADKAIDIIAEDGASQMLVPRPAKRSSGEGGRGRRRQDARIRRMSVSNLTPRALKQGKRPEARGLRPGRRPRPVSSAMKMARAGLRDAQKPIGCYLLVAHRHRQDRDGAPAGLHSGIELLRFDMSEYMGATRSAPDRRAPGTWASTRRPAHDAVDQQQHAVVLWTRSRRRTGLFNILLQVWTTGKLTDSNGKKIDFATWS